MTQQHTRHHMDDFKGLEEVPILEGAGMSSFEQDELLSEVLGVNFVDAQ